MRSPETTKVKRCFTHEPPLLKSAYGYKQAFCPNLTNAHTLPAHAATSSVRLIKQ